MTEELTVTDVLTAQEPVAPHEFYGGIIRVSYHLLEELVDIRGCNIQREFEDKGVFAALHKKLLLPANYTIRALFYTYMQNAWEIVVESPDLPPVGQDVYPPEITPVYEVLYNQFEIPGKTYRLKEIKIEKRWQRTYSPDELTPERL